MQVFYTKDLKLLNFCGIKPSCICSSINKQEMAILTNKDKTPSEIYLDNPSLFKNTQQVNNLKHKLNIDSSENELKTWKNLADELQEIQENFKNKDHFVQEVYSIEKLDINGVNVNLPLIILYNPLIIREMLNSALKNKVVLHFDKTFNTSIFHLSTIIYKSNSILHRKNNGPAQMLGIFLLHKSSSKKVFSYFFKHFKNLVMSLLEERNLNLAVEDLFSICTDQEKGITSAINETFLNMDLILCKKHISDNIPHNIKNKNFSNLLRSLTNCNNEDQFIAKKNLIFESNFFVECDPLEKKYVISTVSLIFHHVLKPLLNMCSCEASCLCKPLTNNLAESANHRIKSWFHFKKCTPTKVIAGLKKITNLQLVDIEKMFSDQGNFLCPEACVPFTNHDKDLLNLLFNQFFFDELDFSNSVVEPVAKKKRNFKSKAGSSVVFINGRYYIKSSDGRKLYPLALTSTAHKPYKAPNKTRSYPKLPK